MKTVFLRLFLGGIAVLGGLAGCGAEPPCASSSLCSNGTVCAPSGACRARDATDARFASASIVHAVDWGVTRRDRGHEVLPDSDLFPIGGAGDARAYLSFGPLPDVRAIGRAYLVIDPHESWAPPRELAIVAFHRVAPFIGIALSRRTAPRITSRPVVRAAIAVGATRRLRVDVTDAVRDALDERARRISFAVVLETSGDGGPETLRFASPRAFDDRARPRLEVLIR